MVKTYEVNAQVRRVNRLMSFVTRRGWGRTELLTTTGRKTNQPRTTPVTPSIADGIKYIVSPYGEVGWVHNVRANPAAVLTKGKRRSEVTLVEVTGQPGSAQVVADYYEAEAFARGYMDVPENPTVADFEAAASFFPIFKVE